MASNWTIFTNESAGAGGSSDFVRDVFGDVILKGTSNSGLTSSASTNPLGNYYGNDDLTRFGVNHLWIKDLLLIDDTSLWINNKPTYKIIFTEDFPQINAYAFGNISYEYEDSDLFAAESGKIILNFKDVTDGISINGIIRRVGWIVNCSTAATATAQIAVDGSNTTTIDFSSINTAIDSIEYAKFALFKHAASNETQDIHDIRLTALQTNTLKLSGIMVYHENSGANIEQRPGVAYADKTKVTTTQGASLSLAAFGSSLGGMYSQYLTTGGVYGQSAKSHTSIVSVAQGSSGTNLLTVTTGQGGSFVAGYGVVVGQGTSMYVGLVQSVSTDTLTVFPTLPFGISNTIYRSFSAGSTYAIGASYFKLQASIDFQNQKYQGAVGFSALGVSNPILDVQGRYGVWGSNLGYTLIDNTWAYYFKGASGFLQVDGRFSAAEVEYVGDAINHATFSVDGLPCFSINAGQTGKIKRTIFTDAGGGFNNFVIGAAASMGVVGIYKINLYQRERDLGISYGFLSAFQVNPAYTERAAAVQNATMTALGTYRRTYSDQLYLKGAWTRGVTSSAAGGVIYYGTSTNSSLSFQYYGKNTAIIGTNGTSGVIQIDGGTVGHTFNIMQTVATEGFHTLTYQHQAGTCVIEAVDFAASKSEMRQGQPVFDKYPIATNSLVIPKTGVAVLKHTTASGVDGPALATTGADTLTVLNTIVQNTNGIVTDLTGNVFTLLPGKYKVDAFRTRVSSSAGATRLKIKPSSATAENDINVVYGNVLYYTGAGQGNTNHLRGYITLRDTTAMGLYIWQNAAENTVTALTDGNLETWNTLVIEKLE